MLYNRQKNALVDAAAAAAAVTVAAAVNGGGYHDDDDAAAAADDDDGGGKVVAVVIVITMMMIMMMMIMMMVMVVVVTTTKMMPLGWHRPPYYISSIHISRRNPCDIIFIWLRLYQPTTVDKFLTYAKMYIFWNEFKLSDIFSLSVGFGLALENVMNRSARTSLFIDWLSQWHG